MKTGFRDLLLLLGDVLMLLFAFFVMLSLAFPGNITEVVVKSHAMPFAIISLVWLFIFFLFSLYEPQRIKPTIPNLELVGLASLISLATSVIMLYTIPYFGITPKTNLVIFSMSFAALFIFWRRIFYAVFAKNWRRSVVFIIDGERDLAYANELRNYINNYPQSGFSVMGDFKSVGEFEGDGGQADTLIVSPALLSGSGLKKAYERARNVFTLARAYEDILGKVPVGSIDEGWFLYNVTSKNKVFYERAARITNFLLALLTLVITLPVTLLIALCVKLGGGRIFYIQDRVGRHGKTFRLYKFRTMVAGADRMGKEWTEKNDPRITKIGKILRRVHLDEIPQLLNVLRGDMALVGPRPEIPSFAEKLAGEIPHYNLRHMVLPGFTGWAQIKWRNARGVAESKEKFEYDLYYIKNRNLFLDLGIILRTVIILFTHDA